MRIEVFTFRDRALLSPFAHDLCLEVAPVVTLSGSDVRVRCPVAAIRVRGKVVRGAVEPMSPGDRAKIEATLRGEVLAGAPEIEFSGVSDSDRVVGQLSLNGRSVGLELPIVRTDGVVTGEVELTPSRWGVKPYVAMFGALKVQDRVRVRFRV